MRQKDLSPRDLACMADLRERGLSIIEVKISAVSPWQYQQVQDIPLPADTRVLCIGRGASMLVSHCERVSLQIDDVLYIMTNDVPTVRRLMTETPALTSGFTRRF